MKKIPHRLIRIFRRVDDSEAVDYKNKYKLIKDSGLFDEAYYLRKNKDVARAGVDPIQHYINHGGSEGRDPGKLFDTRHYLEKDPIARETGANPLVQYLMSGDSEGRFTKKKARGARNLQLNKTTIDIINVNFFDWEGRILYKGGAERYVFDLSRLLIENGCRVRILQNATTPFTRNYRGVDVVGVKTGAQVINGAALRHMSRSFKEYSKGASLIIASPMDLACEIDNKPVIGINHGIHWDNKSKRLYAHKTSDYSEIMDALRNIQKGVCVDTNFINWTRTYDYTYAKKLKYIPNYYDKKDFRKTKKDFSKDLVFVYPRRLYEARGINITLEAFDYILEKHSNVKLLLVGQTDDKSTIRKVNLFLKKHRSQARLTEYDMEEMHVAYEHSHVALIPTLFSEGTSLSCIEAMATNNAVIVSNVGGLPNLVFNNFNGIMISPTAGDIIRASEYLIKNRDIAEKMAKNSLSVAETFEKKSWEAQWLSLIRGGV